MRRDEDVVIVKETCKWKYRILLVYQLITEHFTSYSCNSKCVCIWISELYLVVSRKLTP